MTLGRRSQMLVRLTDTSIDEHLSQHLGPMLEHLALTLLSNPTPSPRIVLLWRLGEVVLLALRVPERTKVDHRRDDLERTGCLVSLATRLGIRPAEEDGVNRGQSEFGEDAVEDDNEDTCGQRELVSRHFRQTTCSLKGSTHQAHTWRHTTARTSSKRRSSELTGSRWWGGRDLRATARRDEEATNVRDDSQQRPRGTQSRLRSRDMARACEVGGWTG